MIISFSCKETKKISDGKISLKFPRDIQYRALGKLRQLDAASCVDDLRMPSSNHLEKLKGDLSNEISIRINNQWRLCFIWEDGGVHNVRIADYH